MALDLKILQEVQEYDKEIYQLQEALEDIPLELSEASQAFDQEKNKLKTFQDEVKNIQLKQKQKEGELSTKEDNIKKLDNQLSQVKTNKEYSSLQGEIASLKADNSLLEEAIINLMDQVQVVQKQADEQKKKVDAAESVYKQKKQELEAKAGEVRKKIEALRGQKKDKIKDVNPEIASLYERIVEKKNGIALVKVEGEVCPACQLQLRPQTVNEIKMKERVIICDNCSRILYSE